MWLEINNPQKLTPENILEKFVFTHISGKSDPKKVLKFLKTLVIWIS